MKSGRASEPPTKPRGDMRVLRAAFYGLYLREQGYSADETALLVSKRYPCVERRLARLRSHTLNREHEAADTASSGLVWEAAAGD